MKYQFQIDGRPAGPVRNTWKEAAQDAVNDGYAVFSADRNTVKLNDQAAIARTGDEQD